MTAKKLKFWEIERGEKKENNGWSLAKREQNQRPEKRGASRERKEMGRLGLAKRNGEIGSELT